MTIDDFLPNDSWMADPKTALKQLRPFRTVAGAAAIGYSAGVAVQVAAIVGAFSLAPAMLILAPFLFPIWAVLIRVFAEQQKAKKVVAIMKAYPDKYTKEQLNSLYDQN